jgi:protein TonB
MDASPMFPVSGKVLFALLFSMLLHALVYSIWPSLQPSSSEIVMMQGELIPPEIHDTPKVNLAPPLPEARPVPVPVQEEPPPIRHEPVPASRQNPDKGVALPLLSENTDAASASANDYVVADTPPLNHGDELPFASRPGATPLDRYTPASNTGVDTDNEDDPVDHNALSEFGRALRERAVQYGGYPPMAQKRGWQGRAKVLVRFARNGLPQLVVIKESSGHRVLDDRALEMVRQACNDFPLPETLGGKAFTVVVPVDFKLV